MSNPEECSRCGTATEKLTQYSVQKTDKPSEFSHNVWLCCYCEVGHENYPVASMAAMFHVLEARLKGANDE